METNTIVSAEVTPAQSTAEWYRALARHLDEHPHLPPPAYVKASDKAVQIGGHDPADLLAWAHSVGVAELRVDLLGETAHVHADCGIGEVWAAVYGFAQYEGIEVDTVLPVSSLEAFVAYRAREAAQVSS